MLERIADAERRKVELLVFQIDSLGGLKLTTALGPEGAPSTRLVEQVREAKVPVAVQVGPRQARGGGVVVDLLDVADIAAVGPSGRLGPSSPADLAKQDVSGSGELAAKTVGANEALRLGVVDMVSPSIADVIIRSDGTVVETALGPKTLNLPKEDITVRFEQAGPIRRLLHAFSNPTLAYILVISGIMLIVFELFQAGFGVAGVTGGILGLAGVYGFTVLPARAWAFAAIVAGSVLMALDIARDAIRAPTIVGAAGFLAGSIWLLPGGSDATRLSPWLIACALVAALIMFIPVMTVVKRARHPITTEAKRALVGIPGEVRSMLNPEGFAMVDGELWRARSEDGHRMRVGEPVVVAAVDGTVLIVRSAGSLN